MMRPAGSTVVAMLLGLGALADARAATFALEPDVVMVGGSITFSFTSELGDWPATTEGAEQPQLVYFNGPCTNSRPVSAFNQYGYGADIVFPAPGWSNYLLQCSTVSKPGSYLATLAYWRVSAGLATTYFIDLPFTVLGVLGVTRTPGSIPAGGTTLIGASGMSSVDPAASLQVECPDGTVDHAVDVSPLDDGLSIAWPSLYFEGACDSSQPGVYRVTLTTERRSALTGFGVFGDLDGDGWLDGDDNCVNDPNPGQDDVDDDDRGDVCDTDNDGDGISDENDNCPDVANASQDDLSPPNGVGDACDPDIDSDGLPNGADNCPRHANPGQENVDGDPLGDLCDSDPEDSDNDGVSDLVDNCWTLFNPAQQDDDGDGIGTACDPDIDGDGISNADEATAGTHPNDPQPLEVGINPFWEGGAIGSGVSVPDGEPVGVVVNPATDVDSIDVTVVDPWGGVYSQQTLIPQSPVAFYFVPVWPGTWTIGADLNNGEVLNAAIHVIPEPAAALGAVAAAATLLALRRR